jgi:hypothetical protein
MYAILFCKGGTTMQAMRQDAATLLHKLARAGIPVDVSAIEPELDIQQRGGVYDSTVLEISPGLLAYVFEVGITNRTSRAIRCFDLELRLPYPDDSFYWLGDPRFEDPIDKFRVPGTTLNYGRNEVLNHVLLGDGILRPGAVKRGLLLATGHGSAAALINGSFIDATLAIIDHEHTEHSAVVKLWVDRSATLERRVHQGPNREGLFSGATVETTGHVVLSGYQPLGKLTPERLSVFSMPEHKAALKGATQEHMCDGEVRTGVRFKSLVLGLSAD